MLEELSASARVGGDLPWGTHFCYFYEGAGDLIEACVPFIQAGLERHEFCLWIIYDPVTENACRRGLQEAIPDIERHLADGALEIVVHAAPIFDGDFPDPRATRLFLQEKLDAALARGFTGLRVAGSPRCLQNESSEHYRQFEREIDRLVADQHIIALCYFPSDQTNATRILEAARAHQFVIAKRGLDWEIIETPEARRAKTEMARVNEQLEQRVEERTRALEAANEKLRKEIARREQVEEDLRRQKEILQTIFDHVPVAIDFIDQAGGIQMANREWERMVGRSLDEIDRSNLDFIAEGYPDPAERQRALDLVANATSEWEDFDARAPDGSIVHTTWAALRLSDGSKIGIGQDITERKRAEQELRRQKEILQIIFENIPVMISLVDQKAQVQLVNRQWESILGWSLEEIRIQNIDIAKELFPDVQQRQRAYDLIRNPGRQWTDLPTRVRDGRVIDTSWAVIPLSDGKMICIGQDITQRKQAEREFQKQKGILQCIFDHIPVMINFGDDDFGLQLVNREWERVLGWSMEEILRDNVDILAENYPDPEYRAEVRDFVHNSHGIWRDFKTTVRDGRVIDTSWVMLHLPDGINIGIGQDITRRKRAEQEVLRQKELLEIIFDHIPVMLAFIDRNGEVELVNHEWERVLGWSIEEIKNQKIDIPVEAYPDPEDRQRIFDLLAQSKAEWADFKTRVRSGGVVDTTWTVIRLSDGATIWLGQDITERKKAEQKLRQQKEILQTIFDHIPLMISFGDGFVNRHWEKTLGWSLEEIRRDNIDLLAENYPDPQVLEGVRDFLAHSNGEWKDFKTRIRDGSVLDTSWSIHRLSDGTRLAFGQDITSRKRAEEALRESEERFRQLAENIQDLFWIKTPDLKRVIYFSPLYERLSGRPPDEGYGVDNHEDFLDRIHPDDREQMAEIIRRGGGEEFDLEYRLRGDDEWRWVQDRGFPIRDQSGKVYRMAGITRDITDRKIAEQSLRESEERFRQLAENIQDLFWIKTPDFKRALYLSPTYESFIGRSREDRYRDRDYQHFLNILVPEDRDRVAELLGRGMHEKYEMEYRIRRNGDIRWIHDRAFPVYDQSGNIYRVAGIATDITDRKIAEEALRESEERFRQLTENIHEVFWLRTPDFDQLLYISPLSEKIWGKPHAGTGVDLDVVHPEDRTLVAETMKPGGQGFEIEYRIINKEGEVRWLRDRGFPIRNASGEIYRIGGVAEDITDRKSAEEHLKTKSEQLRALSANLQSAREAEATRIAHQIHDDMGGMLTGLRWELEAMEKMLQQPLEPGSSEAIQGKLAAMIGLTDTTINVVRRIASELRPIILDDLGLLEAIEWQAQQFQARTGIECRCEFSLQAAPLRDQTSTAVFRIFQEALTNILRHAQATRVEVVVQEVGGTLELQVSDNGRGITQGEMSNKKSLGLLGMRERAHLVSGHVDFLVRPEGGTRVRVRVPLSGSTIAGGAA